VPRLFRFVTGVACLLAARSATAQLSNVSCGPGDLEVRGLRFAGNHTFPSTQLEVGIATTQPSWWRRAFRIVGRKYCLDSLTVRADSLRLLRFYQQHGFADTRVTYHIAPAGGRSVTVQFSINEGRPVLVDSLTILGLDGVPDSARVVRGLPLREGARFDQFIVEQTRDSIARRLRDRGYPLAEVLRDYGPDTLGVPDSLSRYREVVQYHANPGQRQWIGGVTVTISTAPDTSTGPRMKDTAGANLPSRGVHQHTQLDPAAVRTALGIHPGQLYRETALEGVKRGLYLTGAFRHVDVGFDSASLSDEKPDSLTIDVNVIEADLHAARVSLGWGTVDCIRAQAAMSNYAFMGRLRRLDLTARTSKVGLGSPLDFLPGICTGQVRRDVLSDTLNYYFSATISQAALFGLPFVPSLTLYSERRSEFEAFVRNTPIGLIASVQQGSEGSFPRTYSYGMEYGSTLAQPAYFCAVFNVCEDAARERLERKERTATLGWTGTRIRANSVVNPTRGSVIRLEARHASPLVGSSPDISFNRGVIDASYYSPAMGGALALRLRYGAVLGSRLDFSGSPTFVPPQERLYAGGPNSVRGYRQNELGPAIYLPALLDTIPILGNDTLVYLRAVPGKAGQGQAVVPTGGDNVVVANAELRLHSFFLPDLVQFAVFVDAGQVWNRGRSGAGINYRAVRVTPGTGVRYFSLVGPIRVDVGYNPYSQPGGPAYYNPLVEAGIVRTADVRLICVSPDNELRVRLGTVSGGLRNPPRQIDTGNCSASYAPARRQSFLSRLTINFSIGQAF
jgi:outer membrane protein insertion porin family